MPRTHRPAPKKVTIPEVEEEEKLRKSEAKKAIIRAEFEKHKKEQKLVISDTSKINEIRLKNQLEDLLTGNVKRKENLERLLDWEQTLERQNLEATMFSDTMNKFESSKMSEGYLTVGFHPNRTTSTIFGMTENRTAEVLSEKKAELMETLSNIELLIEQEDEIGGSVYERYEELKRNNFLLSRKTNELKQMNEHAVKRFSDLKRVEFLAKNKEAATSGELKELKDNLRELKINESAYKKQKDDEKRKEFDYVNLKENEMSTVLIELDQKRLELQQKQEELKKLELQHEEMRDKRKTTRIVTKYIETFAALEDKTINLVAAHQVLKQMLERKDSSRMGTPNSFVDSRKDIGSDDQIERRPSGFKDALNHNHRLSKGDDINRGSGSPIKRNSVMDRNYYIDKITNFYEKHPEGPFKLVENLISQYMDHCYKERSLKENFENLQNQKRKQEIDLQMLKKELSKLRDKNEYIGLGRTGSMIIERNQHEAIDSGMLVVETQHTTLNQAKFDLGNKKDADNHTVLFSNTEAFIMRCYLDTIEMMSRISKVLSSIHNQSGGILNDELKDIVRNIQNQVNTLKKPKKGKQQQESSMSQNGLDPNPELQRTQTGDTGSSDKAEQDSMTALDFQEVFEIFLATFEGYTEKASQFIAKTKNDVMISSFISAEEIKNYLQNFHSDFLQEGHVQKAIDEVETLRELGIANMIQRFENIYRLYTDFVAVTEQAAIEGYEFLESKGRKTVLDDLLASVGKEQTGHVKNAIARKWQALKNKYEYDPARDYRRNTREIEIIDQNYVPNQKHEQEDNVEVDKEIWDSEDLKAKINEIVGGGRAIFRGKSEEDQKRLLMKKEKEKQRQKIENMTDEDFLDYQRRIIKEVKEENVHELNEEELFRKAQAAQVSRLSQKVPIEELRRMIENSKVLSKIQILENKKSITDGKRDIKHFTLENYIPHEPKKVPKSTLYSSNSDWKIRVTKNGFTPNSKIMSHKYFSQMSERNTDSDYEGSPKDNSFKAQNNLKVVSRFKPQTPMTEYNTEPAPEREKPYTTKGSNRLSTFENYKKKDREEESYKIPSLNTQEDFKKKNRLLINTMKKKYGDNEPHSTKNKQNLDLPKLKTEKRKGEFPNKKKKKKHNSAKVAENDQLNAFLSLQTDPLLKMVYSPSFFATSFPHSAIAEEMNYKFDSYKFQSPSLLIADKI